MNNEKILFLKQAKALREEYIKKSDTVAEVNLLKKMSEYTLELYGKDSNEYIQILNELAGTAKYVGLYDEAIESLKKALGIIEENTVAYASTLLNLIEVYRYKGIYENLDIEYEKVKKIYEDNNMTMSYEYASLCNNYGLYLQETGKDEKALSLHETSYEILKELKDTKIPKATTLNNMASIYSRLGELKKADDIIEESIKIYEKEVGKEHSMYAAALNTKVAILFAKKEYKEALKVLGVVLHICEKSFGKNGINYIKTLENIKYIEDILKTKG